MSDEKICCEFRRSDGFEWRCVETADGYRIELKGDKESLRKGMMSAHCHPVGVMSCCCSGSSSEGDAACC